MAFFAGEERFELPSMVLETTILPLNYSPKKDGRGSLIRPIYEILELV